MTGVPQAIASIITSPNGSGQSIGNSSARASPRNSFFSSLADLAEELDVRLGEQRLDLPLEVVAVRRVDLGGDLQRHAGRARRSRWRGRARFSGEMRPRKAR